MMNIPPEATLIQELHPAEAEWATQIKTNKILADIFDMLAQINENLIAIGSGKPAKKLKPYPRPVKKDPENEKHFGRGALPPDELRAWFDKKRTENAGSSISNIRSDSGAVRSTTVIN